MVQAVAAQTGKARTLVLATPPHRMLVHLRMADLAGCAGLFRFHLCRVFDLGGVALWDVGLAGTVARFAACHLVLPIPARCQFRVDRMREGLELCFVAVFARFAADILRTLGRSTNRFRVGVPVANGLRASSRGKPHNYAQN